MKTYILIDASNLFYGFDTEYGWKIDYNRLRKYKDGFNVPQRKANCDVDLTMEAMANINFFDRVIVLSGDGDFLPLYKYLEKNGKEVFVLSRTSKTAREVKRHLGPKFIEIRKLKNQIEFIYKKN